MRREEDAMKFDFMRNKRVTSKHCNRHAIEDDKSCAKQNTFDPSPRVQ